MRRFNLLLFGLCFFAAVLSAYADVMEPDVGRIGSTLARIKDSNFLAIEYVAENSPAAEAGIKKGDCIAAINGISTQGMSPEEGNHFIAGDIGSVVKLSVRRQGSIEEEISVMRRSLLNAYLPAATVGDPRAEFDLGYFYEHSPTATRDLTKAAEWYRKAATQGDAWSQASLGYMCKYGLGVPKDLEAATAWYLMAANQGDAVAERELALSYLDGKGVPKSDHGAFAWFYSAAQQDDPMAEQYLGFLYQNGQGVERNDQLAFDWYYRSAQHNDFYGEWGVAYMYEHGLGVKKNSVEALKWYQKAQAGLPQNVKLRRTTVRMSLQAFLENPESTTLDLSLVVGAFRQQILLLFLFLALVYVVGGVILFYFSFRTSDAPPRLSVALGWLAFYVESQGVALLGLCVVGSLLTAGTLIAITSLFSTLPVIASSLGPNRSRIWKTSQVSWKSLLLYGASSCLAIFIIILGYNKIYALLTHSSLPSQPTEMLFIKAKHAFAWLAYASIALALPIAEEIIFRSYLFDALRQRFSGKTVVIITAFMFSLIHFQWLYFVPLFGFGLVLGWVRLKTDSLRMPVILHTINNSLFLAFAV